MTPAYRYRARAAELHAQAMEQYKPTLKAELESLAIGYIRLAQQAERNESADILYEAPACKSASQ